MRVGFWLGVLGKRERLSWVDGLDGKKDLEYSDLCIFIQ